MGSGWMISNQVESIHTPSVDHSRACSIKICCHGPYVNSINKHGDTDSRQFTQNVVCKTTDLLCSQIKYSPTELALTSNSTSPSRTRSFEIELRDLSYKIAKPRKNSRLSKLGIGSEGGSLRKDASDFVLKRINMKARPGEILGVAGPSGAGKSTLLEVLAGQLRPTSPPSSMLVNQQQMDVQQFRRISGYVMQDDALFPLLTVEETLLYSARLRLPASISMAEKKLRVQAIMEELGLVHVANSRIGNDELRGLSGGERRRVSIGVDVIHDPAVLILDEPTSGLDSASALHVVSMLSTMAVSHNRTIILSIHQPSYRILELLHSILLIARGRVIHHGSIDLLSSRLADSGHSIPEQLNMLEYAIDVIDDLDAGCCCCMFGKSATGHPCLTLHYTFDLEDAKSPLLLPSAEPCDDGVTFANSNCQEIVVLVHRFFKNVYRTKQLFRARTLHSLVAGISLGSIYVHMGYGMRGMSERYGLLAFSVTLLLTSTIEVLPSFLEERRILSRETSRGAYRMWSYIVANTLVFLPFLFVNALLFSAPLYWLVGFASQVDAFLFFLLVVWLLLVTAYSFVAFFSAIVPNYQLGYSIIMGFMGAFFLFSGFFISKQNLPDYWLFMHYISLYKYPLEALLINEYTHTNDKCFGIPTLGGTQCNRTGRDVLEQGGLNGDGNSKWINVGIMAAFAVLYRVLCFAVLRFKMGRRRR